MARARYRIGSFVRFTRNGAEETGVISGVLTVHEGYRYITASTEPNDFFDESDVLAAYREITPRKAKASTAPRTKKKAAKDVYAT